MKIVFWFLCVLILLQGFVGINSKSILSERIAFVGFVGINSKSILSERIARLKRNLNVETRNKSCHAGRCQKYPTP
ncbi:hypothetical protein QE152_g22145 [Popillia japonica]|uniref:Uncharacterized protein n=1 Tax=Popillia japonica TaxID=7064 RepID=A0AAW1KLT3_POPJA